MRVLAIAAVAAAGAALAPGSKAGDERVTAALVQAGQPNRCGDVAISGHTARGGCRLTATGTLRFTVLSLFGDRPFGTCPVRFSIRVGADGDLGIARFDVDVNPRAESGPLGAGCGDTHACWRDPQYVQEDEPPQAWPGRLVRRGDGKLEAQIDACFDTCLGRLEGPLRLALEPTPTGAWRLHAGRSAVGTSGLELDGRAQLEPVAGGRLTLGGE